MHFRLEMTSIRRTMSTVKREGSDQNEEAVSGSSLSPKSSHSHNYFAFLPLSGVFLQRNYRPWERSKLKVHPWRRALFHFTICFLIGIFIGFTPLFSSEISYKSALKHQTFSTAIDPTVKNALPRLEPTMTMLSTPILPGNLSIDSKVSKVQVVEMPNTKNIPLPMQKTDLIFCKQLIVVTPTYTWASQVYYLNGLAQTLRSVPPPLLWIVVELNQQSPETSDILRKSGVMYRHLVCRMNISEAKNGAIHQRNVALSHIEQHQLNGILYFADDDMIYSLDLFDNIREIRRFGAWPVATFSENKRYTIVEGPVCNGSQVLGWHTSRRNVPSPRFPTSMGGFAFNSTILWDFKTWHRPMRDLIRQLDTATKEFQVSTFIEQLVEDEQQMECLPDGCSKIMAWHLKSDTLDVSYPSGWKLQNNMEPTIRAHLQNAVR